MLSLQRPRGQDLYTPNTVYCIQMIKFWWLYEDDDDVSIEQQKSQQIWERLDKN
jgi:hypothetical protein